MANSDLLDVGSWVDERLGTLTPANDWQPNASARLTDVYVRRAAHHARRLSRAGAAAVAAIAIVSVPVTRAFAARCVEACVNATASVSQFWRADEPEATTARVVGTAIGNIAPDLVGTDAHGAPILLSSRRGRMVVLNFWATWCPPCKAEIPLLNDLAARFSADDVEVIGVSMDDDGWSAITPFLADHSMTYTVARGDGDTSRAFGGVDSLPATFVIGRDGRILVKRIGALTEGKGYEQIVELVGR